MQERDETITDKEKRIMELKKKNQELEKFKFVLEYKILEQNKEMQPRETDIKNVCESCPPIFSYMKFRGTRG